MVLCFLSRSTRGSPAVVLVLKRLIRWGHCLKSYPTDLEKPGIEPATRGLQDIGLSPTLGEAGNRTCDPWFTRRRFIPYTMVTTQSATNLIKIRFKIRKL